MQTGRICKTLDSSVCTANSLFLIQFINVLVVGKTVKRHSEPMELQVPNSVIFLVRSSAHGESLLVELVIELMTVLLNSTH